MTSAMNGLQAAECPIANGLPLKLTPVVKVLMLDDTAMPAQYAWSLYQSTGAQVIFCFILFQLDPPLPLAPLPLSAAVPAVGRLSEAGAGPGVVEAEEGQ